jgi:hypothetical protein
MSNNIVEENPAQDSKAPSGPQGQGAGGGEEKIRKQARQLAYDVRYKVKQGFKDGQKTDPASLKRAFVSQLGKSPAPGPVKALAKKMLIGEEYDFIDISEDVKKTVRNSIGSVFVKTTQLEDADGNPAYEIIDLMQEGSGEKKYKVRVTDKKTGRSYTRMADRAKISELRKNPNISSVEMTGYGTPYEGEKKKGSSTAAVKSGKGLSKKDYDGDGKRETPEAEYKGSKDKAIKKALHKEHHTKDANGKVIEHGDGTPSSVEEEFIGEVNTEKDNPNANTKKIDVMKGKNEVKINPNMGEQNELAAKATKPTEDSKEKRIKMVKRGILQKKLQAVRAGAGADITASHKPEGEVVSEKKAAKDYDGDGKVESGKDEYFGSKDKAIKKAMGKKHDCASKVKHEEYGLGDCIKGMHDLDESGNVAHYDVFFEHGIEKDVDVSSLEILEYKMHEHVIRDGEVISEKETVKKEINPTVQSALDALNVIEGKKKGLDGKECWDGYKLAGTKKKGGKTVDNCVKVKEDSEYGYDKEGKSLNPDDKPLKDQTNKQVASVTFDGGGIDGGATIQGSGDSREVPTFVNLIMNKIRARGIK